MNLKQTELLASIPADLDPIDWDCKVKIQNANEINWVFVRTNITSHFIRIVTTLDAEILASKKFTFLSLSDELANLN